MNLSDYEDQEQAYYRNIREGVCPDCGGKLDPPHLPPFYGRVSPSGGWCGWRERTCFDCERNFGYYLHEPA